MILNRQRGVAVSLASLDEFWQRARKTLKLPEDSLTICLVSESRIAEWNRRYRGKHGPTDVLSFPAEDGDCPAAPTAQSRTVKGDEGLRAAHHGNSTSSQGLGTYLGDIAIAPAVARRNSRLQGRPLQMELRILILHGVLHLLGYDHETDDGEMNRAERRLRRRLGLTGS